MSDARIITGDCVEAMAAMDEASVDAIVTDPPYGLGFMGKEWDDLPPGDQFAAQAFRVLKPGGHLLAFGGTRTYHRLACAIEDAGFEIRDSLVWMYGSGFPKSLDVSKAIDKAAGAEREVTDSIPDRWAGKGGVYRRAEQDEADTVNLTAPATPEAAQWEGWGTALKPAWESIVVARKPLTGTVAANVLEHGTGALNVDGCRVKLGEAETGASVYSGATGPGFSMDGERALGAVEVTGNDAGRWPANVVLDEAAAALLDEQSGERGGNFATRGESQDGQIFGYGNDRGDDKRGYGDNGGASRFFYVAKASRAEREAGLADFEARNDTAHRRTNLQTADRPHLRGLIKRRNVHPTVKPISLMRWLVRLVTPPGGLVLDPFTGSGTTGCAAVLEGFDFIGIEREAEYAEIAQARIKHWQRFPVGTDAEAALESASAEAKVRDTGQLSLSGE